MQPDKPALEGRRILTICNACRYCEGYCAVFPAMERRPDFAAADLNYLANLCHQCAECYYACQYAPPHEFAVNVPKVLAEIRLNGYQEHAWPLRWKGAFKKSGNIAAAIVLASTLAGLLLAGIGERADFYAVVPHPWIVGIFGAAALFVLLALTIAVRRFWRECGESLWSPAAARQGARDVLTLKYLHSGGAGCTYPEERHSTARRWFHHLTFYGFALCFASTTVAAWYHYGLGLRAPYPYSSLAVVLGAWGGLGLLVGPAGLYWLRRRRNPAVADTRQDGMNSAFLALLFGNSLTGLLLLAARETTAMRPLLVIHLAMVLALFLTLPYGKFVHGMYRAAALLRYAVEERRGRQSHGAGE